jgi:hypothetical protein
MFLYFVFVRKITGRILKATSCGVIEDNKGTQMFSVGEKTFRDKLLCESAVTVSVLLSVQRFINCSSRVLADWSILMRLNDSSLQKIRGSFTTVFVFSKWKRVKRIECRSVVFIYHVLLREY